MDLMKLRRGLMMAMASGAQFVKGTFTVPDSGSTYTLTFGKTFSKYLFSVEADDNSKTQIASSGLSDNRAFCYVGIYPPRIINNVTNSVNKMIDNYNAPTSSAGGTATSYHTCSESWIEFLVSNLRGTGTAATRNLLRGLTYNYYIVEIK